MQVLFRALALSLLFHTHAALSTPLQTRHTYALKDSHNVPISWSQKGFADPAQLITLQIGLKQSRFDELEKQLYEVSDPSHERYGKHLTPAEVHELVQPSQNALSDVHDWLESHGVDGAQLSYSPAKDWIKVQLPVSDIETLLNTRYSVYEHKDGTQLVRAAAWSLPSHLHQHIGTIQPTNSFYRPNARRRTLDTVRPNRGIGHDYTPHLGRAPKLVRDDTLSQVCNISPITPTCLRTLYGTIDYIPKAPGKNKAALNNYDGQTSNRSDVALFLSQYRPDAVSAAQTFIIDVINGGADQQTPINASQATAGLNVEGNLDAELLLSFVYPTPMTAYNTGGEPPFQEDASEGSVDVNEPYLEWLQYILAQDNIPQIISSSYGDDEQTVPYSYAKTVCDLFAQLGARGVTFLCASGDKGVGPSGTCITNDGKNTSTFLPSFPDTCPYVTSVGATKGFSPEVAASDPSSGFASGGGFSNYFPRPDYQSGVVPAYISGVEPAYNGLYNPNGRAYPDIAAQGQQVATTWNGKENPLDGASASTPIAAGILTLVNDALIAAGKPPLGFLNPWLYSEGYKAFTDITSGTAAGCNTSGFAAKEGWDAVTGFGTPNFPKLKAMALECLK